MSEENTRQGFFSRIFAPPEGEEGTTVYSREDLDEEESGTARQSRSGFTVERAAEIIRNLPPEVPRSSAVRIVRQTLAAAGVEISDLETSTKARESRLNSEIRLSRQRIEELKEKTEQVIRTLQEEMRKAREARDTGVAEQEERIEKARAGLEDVEMVRDFFGLPGGDEEPAREDDEPEAGEETQVIERPDQDETQILRRPGPLSDDWVTRGERRRDDSS